MEVKKPILFNLFYAATCFYLFQRHIQDSGKSLPRIMKGIHMSSFKNFSAAQSAPSEEKPTDTTRNAPATNQPVAQPDKAPSDVKDAPKA